MSVTIWRRLLVDRIGIKVLINPDLYKHVYGQFFSMVEMQPELLPAGKMIVIKDKKTHTTCLHYYAAYTHKEAGRREIVDITLVAYKLPGKTNVYRYLTLTFVPVQWEKTVPLERAVQEIGFFGNQNTVCKPTTPKWRSTVERLKERFGVA